MLGEERALRLLERVLTQTKGDQVEVVLLGNNSQLTRFANSYIHQNVAESNMGLRLRLVLGKRVGVASTNDLSQEGIRKVVETATIITQLQEENPDFASLPAPAPITKVNAFVRRTAEYQPEQRARIVGTICRLSSENGLNAAGSFATARYEIAVANSLGVRAYHCGTVADINTVIMSDTSSGYADLSSLDVADIDAEALAKEAIAKALRGRNPTTIPPGEYEVILEEYATLDILDMLAYCGFSASAMQEERSFMKGKFGQRIVGANISIWDDGLDRSGFPLPFDYEGVPKGRVDMIRGGIAQAVVYDSYTATKEGKRSTGHALPAPNTWGPYPMNMFMQAGEASKENMIASTRKGIWVTRFWYTRPVHPLQVIITGMTRDGTFLIENGEVTRPLRNLRFTQSYLEALSNVQMIGKTTKLQRDPSGLSSARVPALKIASWTFQDATPYL
ncbi:MAG: TldD/PmbA family protein [Chloroflexi bacterium]|nr:TldD/PmbA family protein [Chloroflexota bacterium]